MSNIVKITNYNLVKLTDNQVYDFMYKQKQIKTNLERGYIKKKVNKVITRTSLTSELKENLEVIYSYQEAINKLMFEFYRNVMNDQESFNDMDIKQLNFYNIIKEVSDANGFSNPERDVRVAINTKRCRIDFLYAMISEAYINKLTHDEIDELLVSNTHKFKKWLSLEKKQLVESNSWKNKQAQINKFYYTNQELQLEYVDEAFNIFNIHEFISNLNGETTSYLKNHYKTNVVTNNSVRVETKFVLAFINEYVSGLTINQLKKLENLDQDIVNALEIYVKLYRVERKK